MPRLTIKTPKYRLHKGTGQAVITLGGRDHYLGTHGSAESKARYNQLIGEWKLTGHVAPAIRQKGLTVDEVIVAYMDHVRAYYVKDGRPTSSQVEARRSLAPLHEQFGSLPSPDFGPLCLKALQQDLVKRRDWCRTTVNKAIGYIKRMFKWAAGNELVGADVFHRLQTVSGLRKGRSAARESTPVRPVPEEHIEGVLKFAPPDVAAMIQMQRYTGMRPNEVVAMRLCDIDRSEGVWMYAPASHKTEHHGRKRNIFIGPKAQRVLMPSLRAEPDAYLFCPAVAEAKRRAKRHAARRTPLTCGNRPGTNRRRTPKRSPGQRYTTVSYGRSITRACERAFPPQGNLGRLNIPAKKGTRWETDAEWKERLGPKKWAKVQAWRREHTWSPNQLRHNAATHLRKTYGIEAARVVLGHSSAVVTEIYAEMDFARAAQIMTEAG